jgi:hypothetical protein
MAMQSAFPREVVRIMAPQIINLRQTIKHHFTRRNSTHTRQGVRSWIAELRRVDKSSGYSDCVRQIKDSAFPVYRATN